MAQTLSISLTPTAISPLLPSSKYFPEHSSHQTTTSLANIIELYPHFLLSVKKSSTFLVQTKEMLHKPVSSPLVVQHKTSPILLEAIHYSALRLLLSAARDIFLTISEVDFLLAPLDYIR